MKSNFGIFTISILATVLLVPGISLVNAQSYNSYYSEEKYYENNSDYQVQYKSKDKKVLCESGLFADSYDNCPIKCDDTGLFIMKGMDCPIPTKPDLIIDITEISNNTCPAGQGSCVLTLEVDINNLSPIPVNDEFQLNLVSPIPGVSFPITFIPSITANGNIQLTIDSNIGNNCFEFDCIVNGFVDSTDLIMEANEENNMDSFFDEG